MKKNYLTTIFIIAGICSKVYGQQNYEKFIPKKDKFWGYFIGYSLGDTWSGSKLSTSDTVINNKTYFRFIGIQSEKFGELAFLREDTVKKQVFYVTNLDVNEKILYDFSLALNDSFYFDFKNNATSNYSSWYKLDSLYYDTLAPFGWYSNQLSKRSKIFRFKSNYSNYRNIPIYWIEGIGSNLTPLYPFACFNREKDDFLFQSKCRTNLLCCKVEQELLFNAYTSACKDYLEVENIKVETTKISIYPNPVSNNIYLTNTEYFSKYFSYVIFDMNGKKVQQSIVTFANEPIDVSGLNNGLYFLSITDLGTNLHLNIKFIKE